VVVLEQHDQAGGTLHTFVEKDKWEFDTGLHYVGAELKDSKLLRCITDDKLGWTEMDEDYDIAVAAGERIPMCKGKGKLVERLCATFPKEDAAIRKYMWAIFFWRALTVPLVIYKIMPRSIAWLCKPLLWVVAYFSRVTVQDKMKECGLSQKLISVLTYNWGDIGTTPKDTPFFIQSGHISHWQGGGFYPTGGPGEITRAIIPGIERAGGSVFVRAPVESILLSKDRSKTIGVRCRGVDIKCRHVVSSAGAFNTFHTLLQDYEGDAKLSKDLLRVQRLLNPAPSSEATRQTALEASCSMLSLFVGIDGSSEDLSLPATNLWIFPDWSGHDELVAKFNEVGLEDSTSFPAVFLAFPSSKDSAWAQRHPGRSVAEVLAPVKREWFNQWENSKVKHRGKTYEGLKEVLSQRLLDVLVEHYPQLRGKVVFHDLGTPLTNDFYLGTKRGEVCCKRLIAITFVAILPPPPLSEIFPLSILLSPFPLL
jgi:all-trans-retinol 13,14-reductase